MLTEKGHIHSMNQAYYYHAAGVSRRQVQNVTIFPQNVRIIEFQYYIWNQRGKCIQISTNMPGIGSVIREIAFVISQILRKQIMILHC